MSEERFPGELEELRTRLQEAEETLEAIRSGAVDAIVVSGKTGEQVYTLQSADHAYRLLVESINEGTATISADGTILYSNRQFAEMLGQPLEKIIGAPLSEFISQEDRHLVREALRSQPETASRFQLLLDSREKGKIPVQITLGAADLSSAGSMTAVITNLSEQLRYQEIVREEKLSRTIMENSPDGIAVCDPGGMVIRASRALDRYCEKSVLMMPFDQLFRIEIPAENGGAEPFRVEIVLAGKPVKGVEARLDGPGGDRYEIVLNALPLQDESCTVIGCLITMRNITRRKRAEKALQESEERFRLALKNSPVSVAVQDRDLVYRWAYNQRTRRVDEVVGKTDADLFSPEDLHWILENKRRVLRTGEEVRVQKWLTSNGRRLFLDLFFEPIRNAEGEITGIGIAVVDLTERKLAEESENRQREIVEGIGRIFRETVACDTEEQLGAVCLEVIQALTGSEMGFIGEIGAGGLLYDITISNPGWEACAAIDGTGHRRSPGFFKVRGLYGRVLESGRSLLVNDLALHPDSIGTPEGHPPLTAFLGTPLTRDGKVVGLIAVGNRRGGYTLEQQQTLETLAPAVLQALLKKRAESELKNSELRFRAFFENADVGTAELGPDGRFLRVNERLCRMTGYSGEEMLRMTPADFSLPEEALYNREMMDAFLHGSMPVFDMERRCLRKDGSSIWVQITASLILNEGGECVQAEEKPTLVALIAHDITARKKAEMVLQERTQQLQDSNRELESFSYSVAHDLKAPLRAVEGYSRMMQKKYGGELSEDAARMLGVIHGGAERMNLLIDDLLTFAKVLRTGMAVAEIDMDECAREVWDEIRAANPERELEFGIAPLLHGFGDRSLIRQVLFNLLSNAVKFTKERKPAVIGIGCRPENGSIVYCVRDNGAGFDMAYYHKLFGVFQRLHSVGEYEGTGVGLAIVQRIIQKHGGRVWGEGEVDKGASFYFSLPSRKG